MISRPDTRRRACRGRLSPRSTQGTPPSWMQSFGYPMTARMRGAAPARGGTADGT
jgi:hypothetical protein